MTDVGMPYTFDNYRSFLRTIVDDGYEFRGFGDLDDKAVVVRHDIDLYPERALEMARLEADLGVETTYCFMLTTPAYDVLEHVDTIEGIRSLGHGVALHFDPHFYWDERPGTEALESTVRAETETLERLVDTSVDTVSFHMPPEWALGAEFEGFENTYQPSFFEDIHYISDSRQKWRTQTPFAGERPERVQILVHPGLWTRDGEPMAEIVADLVDERHDRVDRYVDRYVEAC